MRFILAFPIILLIIAGCSGPMLNQSTEYLGPSIGSLEERQVLTNLGHFVDNPWATPGHVELASGQIQIQNEVGINLKYPRTWGVSGSTLSKSATNEFDLTPAQSQDQESYSLSPITNSEDLRRLRALYHYAVCPGEVGVLVNEWKIADQYYYNEIMQRGEKLEAASEAAEKKRVAVAEAMKKKGDADADAAKKKSDALAAKKEKESEAAQKQDAARDKAFQSLTAIKNAIPELKVSAEAVESYLKAANSEEAIRSYKAAAEGADKIRKNPSLPPEMNNTISTVLGQAQSGWATIAAINTTGQPAAPVGTATTQANGSTTGAPASSGSGNAGNEAAPAKGKTGAGDTLQYEEYRRRLILGPAGLGERRWLYWRDADGHISGYCKSNGLPPVYPSHPEALFPLGWYGGHEFYTDDPKKLSDLVLFVLGGVSNTVGTNILGSTSMLTNATSRTSKAPQCQLLGNYLSCPSKS